jgi:putative acyltransferase
MLQSFCHFLLTHVLGWTAEVTVPARDKCLICVAPHTSNKDFLLGELYIRSIGQKAGFLMKKEWFFWPLGSFFRSIGGIPVERSRHTSLTDQLGELAQSADYFNLAVTPEGTRQRVETWKRGFYYIALKAGIPIQLFAIDAKHKRIVCTKELWPSGDVEADMKTIMEYYRPFEGCAFYPEKFAIENSL